MATNRRSTQPRGSGSSPRAGWIRVQKVDALQEINVAVRLIACTGAGADGGCRITLTSGITIDVLDTEIDVMDKLVAAGS